MAELRTVVGLGQIDTAIVQPVLGDAIKFIEQPNAADLAEAQGALVRAAYVMDAAAIDAMPNLRVIARTGVGTDLVDVAAASRRGIPVVITPGSNSTAVAEGVFALLLHLAKRLGPFTREIQAGKWPNTTLYPVSDIAGASLGIIGYGRIGRIVSEYGRSLGMRVFAFDPLADVPPDIRAQSLADIAMACDYISLHVPITEDTRGMISQSFIGQCRHGVIFVNCGRGGLIDLDAMEAGLHSGQVGGLGLDVFDEEPPREHQIYHHENVVLSPHAMGLSRKATLATYLMAAQGVRDVLEGREPAAVAQL